MQNNNTKFKFFSLLSCLPRTMRSIVWGSFTLFAFTPLEILLKLLRCFQKAKLNLFPIKVLILSLFLTGLSFTFVSAQDITTGIVGHWKFDEGSGTTAVDSSGSNNTGTLTNGPIWTAGKVGGALDFDGSNDYVNAGSAASLDDLQDFTYSAWIYPRTLGEGIFKGIIVEKAGGSGFKRFTLGDSIGLNFRGEVELTGSSAVVNSNASAVSLNQWQYVAMTYNQATHTVTLYKDGTLLASNSGVGSLVSEAVGDLLIGNDVAMSRTFDGLIDEVRIYNRALTQADIQTLHAYMGGPSDIIPPTISITFPTSGSTVSGSSVTVSANASDPSSSSGQATSGVAGVQFLLDGANLQAEDATFPYSITWNTTTTSNGVYTLTARARDAAGNTAISSEVTVTVNNISSDTQAPTTPSNLSATAQSSSQINLTWTVSVDNVGVTDYRVERCQGVGCSSFTQIATPSTNSYSDTGLTANTTYQYRVRATDAVGNLSGYSGMATTMTQTSSSGGSDADFHARRIGPGVIYSQGFDNFNPTSFPASCGGGWPTASLPECYNPASDGTTHAFLEQSVYVSGDSSTGQRGALRLDTTNVASANTTGDYFIRWPQVFSQNSHFYVQYHMKMKGYVVGGPGNWTSPNIGGQGWKTSVFAPQTGPLCGSIELTTVNFYYENELRLYTACSQDPYTNFEFAPTYRRQQGDYNCIYNDPNPQANCAMFHGDEWNTFYYDVQIGTWGQPNSYVQVYVDRGDGQGMKKWIDAPNYMLNGTAGNGYGLTDLTNYNTNKSDSRPSPATYSTWYDELIISTQPIAAPGGTTSPPTLLGDLNNDRTVNGLDWG
ncbi:MAG: LamG-like jellyroll fold domain-containing protein, partial [Patescibacteria group bacterium]